MDDMILRRAAIDAVHKEFDECLVWDESGKHTADEVERVLADVPSAEVETQMSLADCISRRAAIDALKRDEALVRAFGYQHAIDAVQALPSAQPEKHTEEHTETHSCDYQRTETHDLVSRQAAIDSVCEVCENCEYFYNEKLIQTIKDLPSAEPESRHRDAQRWISVEEALPEDDKWVLCQMKGGGLVISYFHGKYWAYGCKPIAWFPLPEPYKGEQE